ncbi:MULTISPECIES: MFS transporter [unclassified Streptomyces]|uniref:MFS transporter n=1 Tax=unclassified Streptomyces TaxID=2593676 RepID=UPI000DB96E58|nr:MULTISPECIES: MFS transporter [unclassified Streptomyces]MYT71551.1 MFS transporter [Streptomyces sp. SID8367]RAJ83014.1 putative MFS family arabinose efflux permease [Streptomyces sp. PsTaAH-137]
MGLDPRRLLRSSPYRPVVGHPTLRRLLPGFAVSALGDGMAVVAVSWLAIELAPAADRGIWVASAAASYTLSGAAGALLLGRFLRHRPAAGLVGWDAALRAAALGAIPVLHAFGVLGIEGYVALLAISSVLHSWGQAGVYTLIARVLPERDHLAGNAVLSGVGSIATVVGPPLATLLIVFGGPATVLAVDAATFLVLAVTFLVAVPKDAVPEPEDDTASRTAGFAVIRRVPGLSGLLALSFAFFLLFGPVYVALPLYVSDDLGASAGVLAGFYTAFGIGAVAGSVLTPFLRRWRMWPTTVGIVIGFGVLVLPLGVGAPTAVSVVCFGAAGLLWPPYSTLSTTLFQRAAPSTLLPQTLAASSAVRVLSVPLGTALGGPLVAALGAVGALRLSGAGIGAVGLIAALVLAVRAARPHRASEADAARSDAEAGTARGMGREVRQ